MCKRQVGAVAVGGITAQPLGEEALLCLALVGQISVEERPQQRIGLDPVVKTVDQCCDCGIASDAPEQTATCEGVVRFRVGKKSAVLHQAARGRFPTSL